MHGSSISPAVHADLYRDLFETSPDPIFIEDADGVVLDVNEAACRFQGLPREALVGSTVDDLVPEELRAQVRADFRDWISGRLTAYRGFTQKPDGTVIPVELHGVRIRYEGRPAVILHVRDLSELHGREQDFARIFDTMLTGCAVHEILVDDEGRPVDYRYLAVNPAFERVVGKSAEELVGRTVLEVFEGNIEPYWIETFGAVALTGRPAHFENYAQALDKHFEVSAYCPEPGQFVCMVYDITPRVQAMQALKQREDYGRALLRSIPDTLWIVDRDGSYLDVREQAGEGEAAPARRVTREALTGMGLDDSAQHRWCDAIHACLETGRNQTVSFTRNDLLGDSFWEMTFVTMNRDQALVICRDITERVRQTEREQSRERQILAAQKLESLGVLAGGIAHDFNNLLVGIMGNADLALMQTDETHPLRESLEEIMLAGKRASELTQLMLAYSGRATYERRLVDLNELVRETHRLVSAAISKKIQVQLRFDAPDARIRGDVAQLRQLFMNLFTNASDAIGNQPGHMIVSVSRRELGAESFPGIPSMPPLPPGAYVLVEIRDTGSGIAPEALPRIFEPFFTTKFTGRGLGLAAALGIVRGHEGGIALDSRVGEGTSFTIALPAVEAEVSRSPKITPAVAAEAPVGRGAILVVDDEETVRRVVRRVLERIGHTVLEAEHGRAALEILAGQNDSVLLMLLDLTMPVMDGEETLRALAERQLDLPVVLMSGFSESEANRKYARYAVRGFIEKPFEISSLRAKVQEALGPA